MLVRIHKIDFTIHQLIATLDWIDEIFSNSLVMWYYESRVNSLDQNNLWMGKMSFLIGELSTHLSHCHYYEKSEALLRQNKITAGASTSRLHPTPTQGIGWFRWVQSCRFAIRQFNNNTGGLRTDTSDFIFNMFQYHFQTFSWARLGRCCYYALCTDQKVRSWKTKWPPKLGALNGIWTTCFW